MEKLMERFEDKYIPEPMSGCWIWTARVSPAGYGQASYKRKSTFAHRLAWTLFRGPIPEGLCVLHKCDNPPCVNPEHLFIGTQIENIRDCVAKGRINREAAGMARAAQQRAQQICKHGHSLADAHVYQGRRRCRVCQADYCRRYYQQRKSA